MFGFRKRNQPSILWDLHAHIIPGVDDGVRTLQEGFDTISALRQLGYTGCVVTPHVYKDLYDNSHATLRTLFASFSEAVKAAGIEFQLLLAAEYFGDEHLIRLVESEDLLSFGPPTRRRILIEFPYIGEPLYWADVLSAVCRAGYFPVIAHPERYRYLGANLEEWLTRFSSYDVSYQCDLGSLAGQYGRDAQRLAEVFLRRELAQVWGSDVHRPSQIDRFVRPGLSRVGNTTNSVLPEWIGFRGV